MPAAPGAAEALLVLLRWLHALAGVAFLGWTAVICFDRTPGEVARYKEVTEITLLVFLASGAILSFDRLSQGAGNVYAAVLAAKIICAVLAYQFAFMWRRHRLATLEGRTVLAFGAASMLLAAVLKGIFESGQR